MNHWRRLRRFAPWLIFLAALWLLISTFDWAALSRILLDMDLTLAIVVASALVIGGFLVRGVRSWALLRRMGCNCPLVPCVLSGFVGGGLANVTPGQFGEAFRVEMLHSVGYLNRSTGYALFLGERLVDLLVLVGGGLIVISLGLATADSHWTLLGIAGGLCVVASAGLLWLAFGPIPKRFLIMQTSLRQMLARPDLLGINVVGSAISWFFILMLWDVLLRSVGVDLPLIEVAYVMIVVMLAIIASLIPGGLGVSEVVAAALLVDFGIEAGPAEAAAITLRIAGLESAAVGAIAWLCWIQLRKRLRKAQT
jgi:uncharacterized membrane protein YbhN (UPF0104 family)